MTPFERRRPTDAVWFRILERLGLPTLYAVVLLGLLTRWVDAERLDRRELLGRLASSIEKQTQALSALATEQRGVTDALRVTWPRLRIGTPPPSRIATPPRSSGTPSLATAPAAPETAP
jgi:hypothetical protein